MSRKNNYLIAFLKQLLYNKNNVLYQQQCALCATYKKHAHAIESEISFEKYKLAVTFPIPKHSTLQTLNTFIHLCHWIVSNEQKPDIEKRV